MGGRGRDAPQPKAPIHDELIMGTNNSSIVSKRSVERLYFPHENFFRPFVQKPQRRAPLINRGYWLRMRAMDCIVRQFLETQSDKPKVIMNLGCGYDPLPFQCLSRYPTISKGVKFVDIDYKALLLRKRDVIRSNAELSGMLTNIRCPENEFLLLESDQYLQVGCDLSDTSKLSLVLGSAVDLEKSLVLCTAEVSITYMDVEAADALIGWVRTLPEAWFCLLEQIIPSGPKHPFAATMLAHFTKLRTPLNAVQKYQTTLHQEQRFRQAGWRNVNVWNLWELWGTSDFLTAGQRTALDDVEPFDEWEEFALFGCHYFLLVAKNTACPWLQLNTEADQANASLLRRGAPPQTSVNLVGIKGPHLAESASMKSTEYPKVGGRRRFGASMPIRGSDRRRDLVGNFGGLGLESRLNSCDLYVSYPSEKPFYHQAPPESPPGRMCHTITDLGDSGALLVGGRASPDNAFTDCWLFHKWTNTWERVDDLPSPRYRHSAIAIGDSVLVVSGKSDSRTFHSDFLVWNRRRGWLTCAIKILGNKGLDCSFPVRFGAILAVDEKSLKNGHIKGILAGGISRDRLISEEVWLWTMGDQRLDKPSIILEILDLSSSFQSQPSLARFGATVIPHLGRIFTLGGVARNRVHAKEEDIIAVTLYSDKVSTTIQTSPIHLDVSHPRPLIIGSSALSSGLSIVIFGGGAVCFSFGAFWNSACFTLDFGELTINGPGYENQESQGRGAWRHFQTFETTTKPMLHDRIPSSSPPSALQVSEIVAVPRRPITSSADFAAILHAANPTIIEGLALGSCTELWTSEYLKDKIGVGRKVIVHQSSVDHMDFNAKNFSYVTKPFGEFIDAIDSGEKLYLRALSSEKPTELPTDFEKDYPTIAGDFQLPTELATVTANAHSSPLRISGPVNMWLHYDVMANVLCQIRGSKRLMLFPPSDVHHFDFAPGSSSSSADVFKILEDTKLAFTHPHEAILLPGDVLFLPALWLHAAMPIGKTSVAVNVFFRNFEDGYTVGRDVYGNRDLQAYERGRRDIAKIEKYFSKLPSDIRGFYIQRLAGELREKSQPS